MKDHKSQLHFFPRLPHISVSGAGLSLKAGNSPDLRGNKRSGSFKMACCTKIMWVMCVNQKCHHGLWCGKWESVSACGWLAYGSCLTSEERRKIWVGKPGQESCIYVTAVYDTLMSNVTFTWKVKWETKMECLLLCSKNNIELILQLWSPNYTLCLLAKMLMYFQAHTDFPSFWFLNTPSFPVRLEGLIYICVYIRNKVSFAFKLCKLDRIKTRIIKSHGMLFPALTS